MWQCIEQAVVEQTGQKFSIIDKQPISGGDINLAYKISDGQNVYFVKLNNKEYASHFESEAYALQQIKSLNLITCPEVITTGVSLDKSFLVLNYIPFTPPNPTNWHKLGTNLALMHKNSQHGQFGWQQDNYIGNTLQPNNWSSNWRTFFAEQRIAWQLQLLNEKSIKIGDIDHITQICHDGLLNHSVTPSLVHGDLWQGNLGFSKTTAIIFDPACYYGDREVDIAMTELFGCLPPEFYQAYQAIYPLQPGFEERKVIYNFYHILNHANLFGGVYIEQAKAMLSRIMSIPIH
ncbi:MAG: fructosamine kinase family protein [Alteromonadaceae bacterium]|nr:fructosamine kinase family protein [Alteromonadaceae bacterium]